MHHRGVNTKSGICGLVAKEQYHVKMFVGISPLHYLPCLHYLAVCLPMCAVEIIKGDVSIYPLILQGLGNQTFAVGKLICRLGFGEHHKNMRFVVFFLTVRDERTRTFHFGYDNAAYSCDCHNHRNEYPT